MTALTGMDTSVHIKFVKIAIIMFHNIDSYGIELVCTYLELSMRFIFLFLHHSIKNIIEPRLSAFRSILCSIATRTVYKSTKRVILQAS